MGSYLKVLRVCFMDTNLYLIRIQKKNTFTNYHFLKLINEQNK